MRFDARRFVVDSLRHYWRLNAALALGVAVATAVLTGALLVGDSVRGSLRDTALDRLGKIDVVLAGERFFRETLAAELLAAPDVKDHYSAIVPGVMLPATLERPASGDRAVRKLGGSQALGVPADFWSLGETTPKIAPPKSGEIVLNAEAAGALDVKVGDDVILRLPEIIQLPRDSAFAHKDDAVRTVRLKLAAVIESNGLGRFGMTPSQEIPRLAYVDVRTIQNTLEQYESKRKLGFVNSLFIAGREGSTPSLADDSLAKAIHPTLEDYGLKVTAAPRGYLLVSSNRMLIDPAAVKQIEALTKPADRQQVLTYLADSLVAGRLAGDQEAAGPTVADFKPAEPPVETAYAVVSAIDFRDDAPFGPFLNEQNQPAPSLNSIPNAAIPPIALTRWAADELKAKVGDAIELNYFPAEGNGSQSQAALFRVASIIELKDAADDRLLTPEFPGITDSLTIGDWDAPFDFKADRVKPQDEEYWEQHRATPKAYISLEAGRKLWGSRFGDVSGVRLRTDLANGATVEQAAQAFADKLQQALDPQAMGFVFQPIKAQQLAAASGSTPFDALFLGFSLFLIAAAVMLAGLLFRLNVETRAHEIGVLMASGVKLTRVRRMLAMEAVLVALGGAAVGVALGVGYAWLMIFALRSPTLWLAAVGVPFLELHVTPLSLVLGLVIGVAVCALAIWVGTWSLDKTPVRRLLAGRTDDEAELVAPPSAWTMWLGAALVVLAAGLVPLASGLNGMAQAGAFFGAGAALLTGMLLFLRGRLRGGRTGAIVGRSFAALRLAMRNVARNPGRSVLTVGLVASATFLIVAMSAFHLDPSLTGPDKASGNGGFYYVAESDQPYYGEGQKNDGDADFSLVDQAVRRGSSAEAFRVRPGDDASCLNLYQPKSPRVIGAPASFIQRGGFAWASSEAQRDDADQQDPDRELKNPWLLLNREPAKNAQGEPIIPAVLDMATAMYGLKVGLGSEFTIPGDDGRTVTFHVVGLLDNSVLQGDVVISAANFTRLFPQRSGFQFFLIETPDESGPATFSPAPDSAELAKLKWSRDEGLFTSEAEQNEPWSVLARAPEPFGDGTVVYGVADRATLKTLNAVVGGCLCTHDEKGRPLYVVLSAVSEDPLAGTPGVLLAPNVFAEHFPKAGTSATVARSRDVRAAGVATVYEQKYGDLGFIVEKTSDRLARFLSVQNTYLVTFQSLGGLGLLLGAFGVAAVQLRNVLERRSELALMQAVGFRKTWLARMVFWETLVMLAGGLIVGTLAAALAISAQLLSSAASIPWLTLGVLLGLVVICGLVAAGLAVRATLRIPMIAALRD